MTIPASIRCIMKKVNGEPFNGAVLKQVVADIQAENLSDPQIAMFLTACAAHPLSQNEICALTEAMMNAGPRLDWGHEPIVDKHCVGGLPGNRTTPIVVAVIAALGLTIPKTSSRAITSASGTADTMEVLAPVGLSIDEMRQVVERENGCIIWGGAVGLSPVDDDIVRVAREIGIDGEGQLVASILSKKLAAGSTHVVIDIPVGATAKIKSIHAAKSLEKTMTTTANNFGLSLSIALTNGAQPIGFGIGPALEARDVVAVLQNSSDAPVDLRDKAMGLAGMILEMAGLAAEHEGRAMGFDCLASGKAWTKFQNICEAQGGLRDIPKARHSRVFEASGDDVIEAIDNFAITRLAKMLGAPEMKTAGIDLFVKIGKSVAKGEPLFTLYSNSKDRLDAAWMYAQQNIPIGYRNQKERIHDSLCK